MAYFKKYGKFSKIVDFFSTVILSISLISCHSIDKEDKPFQIPKNIIVLICDGCGYNHIAATSFYQYGELETQPYDSFPIKLAMSTYSESSEGYDVELVWEDFDYLLDSPTDSSAAATAMASGTKTFNRVVGMDVEGNVLKNFLEVAEEFGKSTGIVTSVPVTHATPAGFAVHVDSRAKHAEIAQQYVYDSKLDVVMGAGHPLFDLYGQLVDNADYNYVGGEQTWNDLLAGEAGSNADDDGVVDYWTFVQSRQEFLDLASGETPKRVFGLAKVGTTLQANRRGESQEPFDIPFITSVPSLAEMSQAALNVLNKNEDGLTLVIEGGAVDWMSHRNNSARMIEEHIQFNNTVQSVIDWVEVNSSWNESLVIVTSDHETGYLTGPGSGLGGPVWTDIVNNGKGVLPGLQWNAGSHTNSLVPVFVKGTAAENFRNYILGNDIKYGEYIDNTSIADVILSVLQ